MSFVVDMVQQRIYCMNYFGNGLIDYHRWQVFSIMRFECPVALIITSLWITQSLFMTTSPETNTDTMIQLNAFNYDTKKCIPGYKEMCAILPGNELDDTKKCVQEYQEMH